MEFKKADSTDVQEISKLYDDVCEYLSEHKNYPGWKKGIYPTIDDANAGLNMKRFMSNWKNIPKNI